MLIPSYRLASRAETATKALVAAISATLLLFSTPAIARQGKVALTFDDLPALTILSDQAYIDFVNTALLRCLAKHRFPAIGFVNEGKLDAPDRDRQIANLERWLNAGTTLGNHTFSHQSPNVIGPSAYVADIARGETLLRPLMVAHGQTLRWFRHPYLKTGYPVATKLNIDAWLIARGYSIAPVTIDADDWEFAEPYDDAIARHDRKQVRRIMWAYLRHTAMRLDWAERSARMLFGRDISHVMLLHCTRLNADALDRLAVLFRQAHLRPVSIEEAMKDPAYRTPDRYVGKDGPDWLERWSQTLRIDLPANGDEDPPRWIQNAYDRVDNDRS